MTFRRYAGASENLQGRYKREQFDIIYLLSRAGLFELESYGGSITLA